MRWMLLLSCRLLCDDVVAGGVSRSGLLHVVIQDGEDKDETGSGNPKVQGPQCTAVCHLGVQSHTHTHIYIYPHLLLSGVNPDSKYR